MLVWRENDGMADASVTYATDITMPDRKKIILFIYSCLLIFWFDNPPKLYSSDQVLSKI